MRARTRPRGRATAAPARTRGTRSAFDDGGGVGVWVGTSDSPTRKAPAAPAAWRPLTGTRARARAACRARPRPSRAACRGGGWESGVSVASASAPRSLPKALPTSPSASPIHHAQPPPTPLSGKHSLLELSRAHLHPELDDDAVGPLLREGPGQHLPREEGLPACDVSSTSPSAPSPGVALLDDRPSWALRDALPASVGEQSGSVSAVACGTTSPKCLLMSVERMAPTIERARAAALGQREGAEDVEARGAVAQQLAGRALRGGSRAQRRRCSAGRGRPRRSRGRRWRRPGGPLPSVAAGGGGGVSHSVCPPPPSPCPTHRHA